MSKPTILVVSPEVIPFGIETALRRGGDNVLRARVGTEPLGLIPACRPSLVNFSSDLGDIGRSALLQNNQGRRLDERHLAARRGRGA